MVASRGPVGRSKLYQYPLSKSLRTHIHIKALAWPIPPFPGVLLGPNLFFSILDEWVKTVTPGMVKHPFHPWSPPGSSGLGTASSGDANARLQERMIGWSMELSAPSWRNGSRNFWQFPKRDLIFLKMENYSAIGVKKWELRNGCQRNYRRGLLDVKVGLE